jgi:hypothetical protein
MRQWGIKIKIDGAWVRTNVKDLRRKDDGSGKAKLDPDNHGLFENVVANSASDAEAYEARTQNVLREIESNPAGKILLEAFLGLRHSVTIRPVTKEVGQANAGEASADDGPAARNGDGSDVVIWYDPLYASNDDTHDPGHHTKADDVLFHECVHAIRQVLGVFSDQPARGGFGIESKWGGREEFVAVMLTDIYLSRAGRDADLRGDHGAVFNSLVEGPEAASPLGPFVSPFGKAFATSHLDEILDFKRDTSVVFFPMAAMPLGWNPLREVLRQTSSPGVDGILSQARAPSRRSGGGLIPLDNWGFWNLGLF